MNYTDTTVIIPTLNEGRNIGQLLELITSYYKGIKAIVSDDGSTDGTAEEVRRFRGKGVVLLDRSGRKKGLTASVIDAAKLVKTKYTIVIDGDLQHPPEKIAQIRQQLSNHDIVGASRNKILVKWALHRKAISKAATLLAKARLGRKSTKDPLSGFFGVKSALFKNVLEKHEQKFEKSGYKVFFELLKYSKKASITEIQYDFGLRAGGESKIRTKHALLFLRSIFK